MSFFIMSSCNDEDVESDAEPNQNNELAASVDEELTGARCNKDDVLACYLYLLLQQSGNVPPNNETTIDGIFSRRTDKTLLPKHTPEDIRTAPNDTRAGCTDAFVSPAVAQMEPDWNASANACPLARASDLRLKADAAPDETNSKSTPIENISIAWLALLFAVFIVAILLWQTHGVTSDLMGVGLYAVCMTALWLFVRVNRTTKYKHE